jgi:hypothetical protein
MSLFFSLPLPFPALTSYNPPLSSRTLQVSADLLLQLNGHCIGCIGINGQCKYGWTLRLLVQAVP